MERSFGQEDSGLVKCYAGERSSELLWAERETEGSKEGEDEGESDEESAYDN